MNQCSLSHMNPKRVCVRLKFDSRLTRQVAKGRRALSVLVMSQSFPRGTISELVFWEMSQKVTLLHSAALFGLSFQFDGFGSGRF
jgi:hypothetical protein